MDYDKPPLTFVQQIEHLISRGLAIPDKVEAAHYLAHLNYYRLRAYWLPLESDSKQHIFKEGASFDQALDLYVFDRKLRLLVLDAIEQIEVSLRTQWAYLLAHRYGSHAYTDRRYFKSPSRHAKSLAHLCDEVSRSDETFIEHYRRTYTNPKLPPVWVVCEVLTLGQLSRWYDNLAKPSDRQAIASSYGLDEKILCSFFHHLSIVRNLCAHHSRLWNRRFVFTPKLPKRPARIAGCIDFNSPRNLYNTLVLIRYVLSIIDPRSNWKDRLVALLGEDSSIDAAAMGFPNGWQRLEIWSDARRDPSSVDV